MYRLITIILLLIMFFIGNLIFSYIESGMSSIIFAIFYIIFLTLMFWFIEKKFNKNEK
ncbi:hypothetical protein JCM19029_08680 [Salinicoccus sesuvii]